MNTVFIVNDLLKSGTSRKSIAQLRRNHERVGWGAYCPPIDDEWLRYRARCEAALKRLQTSAYLSGPSAAAAWGLPLIGRPPQEVFVGGIPRGSYQKGIRVLPGHARTTMIGDFLVADAAWTVATCARVLSSRDALIVADAALHAKLCTQDELEQICASLRGTPGVGRLRWVIDNADPLSESPGETWTRMVVTQLGYEVISQHTIVDGDFRARLDLLIEGQFVGLEFDGQQKYESPEEPVIDEKRRQARVELLGYQLVRVIWENLSAPAKLDRRIRNAGGRPTRSKSVRKPPATASHRSGAA